MTYMGNLKKGDRVRVTFEADVKFGSSFGVDFAVGDSTVCIKEGAFSGVEFEKIEPPVEVFKQGDTVRAIKIPTYAFSLGANGYFDHVNGIWIDHSHDWDEYRNEHFTSEEYEKVNLG